MDAIVRFQASLATQRRVIVALFFREMRTRFGQSRLGYIWALAEPISHVATLSLIFAFMGRLPPLGTNMVVFFFTGIGPFLFYRNIASRSRNAVSVNRALLSYPPVRPIDTIVARSGLELATMTFSTLLLGLALYLLGLPIVPDDPLGISFGILLASLLGLGIGLFDAGIITLLKSWGTVSSWVQRILYFLSGIFFVVDFLPTGARDILQWLPTVHIIAIVRDAHYPGYNSEVADPIYPLLWALSLLALGLLLERILRRRTEE